MSDFDGMTIVWLVFGYIATGMFKAEFGSDWGRFNAFWGIMLMFFGIIGFVWMIGMKLIGQRDGWFSFWSPHEILFPFH
ncbi:MAG: hypothetical protein HY445_02745 [Candidatus Niyogibacteria bacterium]|nr:hypothetical protein [Candidatus Niyogibacteria bacterium]